MEAQEEQMQQDNHKIGFWQLVSIVISCELGSSIFLLPKELAQFGFYGLVGWIVGGIGAVMIAVTFAFLCSRSGITGSACKYVKMSFGEKAGFFMNWAYWCAAWMCNPIIISTSISYLMEATGYLNPITQLMVEIAIVLILTIINTRGIQVSSNVEICLTIFKILPLLIVPVCAIKYMSLDNITSMKSNYDASMIHVSIFKIILLAALKAFWGFTGLEGCTSTAEFVKESSKTLPLAIIVGTSFVAIISLFNTLSIFAIIKPDQMQNIDAPFAHVMMKLFGENIGGIVGIMTFVMCIGSINAWILFSGQIARSAVKEEMMPEYFGKLNKYNVPARSLWISAIGTIIILCILKLPFLNANAISDVVDMSVVVYIVLYVLAILSYIKIMINNKEKSILHHLITILALVFCIAVLVNTEFKSFAFLAFMFTTGVPAYIITARNASKIK